MKKLRIKEILKEKNIPVTELARRLNVTRGCCYGYINGNPTVEILDKIAESLDVSITDLFDDPNNNSTTHKVKVYVSIDDNMFEISEPLLIDYILTHFRK